MSANFLAVGIVSVRPIAETHSYMCVGIGTNEVLSHNTYSQEGGKWKHFWLGDVVGMLLGGRRMQQPTINGSGKSD